MVWDQFGSMAAAIPAFRNFCIKVPPSGHFVFTGCHTKILLPATPLEGREKGGAGCFGPALFACSELYDLSIN